MQPLTLDELVQKEMEVGMMFGPFHREWLINNRGPESARKYIARERERAAAGLSPFMGARQYYEDYMSGDFPPAGFTAVASTASETNIVGNTAALIAQFCQIPANDARAGKAYEVRFGGIISNTGTPTVIWTPRWGSSTTVATNVTFGASPTITTVASLSNHAVYGQFTCGIRTGGVGATAATAHGTGFVQWGNASATASVAGMGGTAATVDTTGSGTAGCGITINLTWSASSPSNTFTCQWFMLRSLN